MIRYDKVRKLLKDARDEVPFYTNMIPEQIDKVSDKEIDHIFPQIHPTDKNLIRKDYSRFVCNQICDEMVKRAEYERHIGRTEYARIDGSHIYFEYTSGSSGTPFITVKTMNERLVLAKALWKERNKLICIKPNEAFNCNDSSLHSIEADDLVRNGYKMWMVNVNRLEKFKKYFMMNNLSPVGLSLIENAGSFITIEEQLAYEKFFNCIVSNYYGCTETWGIAYSCGNKELHLMEDTAHIELLDENDKIISECGRVGTVTVTSYVQSLMPFIRYKTGDLAYYIPGKCQCGNPVKVIRLVPNRNMIKGTNMYGNNYFRNILLKLITEYKINKFKNISVVQTGLLDFDVNVIGNFGSKSVLESGFVKAAKLVFERDDYEFVFHYDEPVVTKSIFSLSADLCNMEHLI